MEMRMELVAMAMTTQIARMPQTGCLMLMRNTPQIRHMNSVLPLTGSSSYTSLPATFVAIHSSPLEMAPTKLLPRYVSSLYMRCISSASKEV